MLRNVQRTGEPLVVADATTDDRFSRDPHLAGAGCCSMLVAGQLAVSVDNAQLYDELTSSRARIVTAADQTRRRIERDLHDGVQQQLVALAFRARTARALAPPDARELVAQLDDLAAEATTALDELRELARGIHPAILAEGGLGPAPAEPTSPVEPA